MSTCISRHGEYSSHLPLPEDEWSCELCGAVREDALRAEVERLRATLARVRALIDEDEDDPHDKSWNDALRDALDGEADR